MPHNATGSQKQGLADPECGIDKPFPLHTTLPNATQRYPGFCISGVANRLYTTGSIRSAPARIHARNQTVTLTSSPLETGFFVPRLVLVS
jgi:hypothetical protein